tara:strand:- start:7026 stop:7877 length:852 start_codon:yes stop_codon:yes gene_type:complete
MIKETPAFARSAPVMETVWFRSAGRLIGDSEYRYTLGNGVPCVTLFLHLKGKADFSVGTRSWVAEEQTATLLLPTQQKARWSTRDSHWEFLWLTCAGDASLDFLSQFGSKIEQDARKLNVADFNRINELMQHLIASGRSAGLSSKFDFQRIAMDALLSILTAFASPNECEPGRRVYDKDLVQTVDDYLSRPEPSPDRVDEVAKILNSTPVHVSRVFRKTVGVSLKSYMVEHRINQAKQLLAETTTSVSNIGELVGYSDLYHFSRLFKKRVGQSPSQFRQNYWH